MTEIAYPGGELELFARAHNWKSYLHAEIRPFLGRDVLEVGAGLGATTQALADPAASRWLCVEPDPALTAQLRERLAALPGPIHYDVHSGSLRQLPADAAFDTVLYVDVLEHIEHDAEELALAAAKLRPGGHLVVLSPAHDFLMSAFDRAIGHHRRYDEATLSALSPPGLELLRMRYLDSCGMVLSLANRMLLRQSLPTAAQIAFWDRRVVPISRHVDPWFAHRLGKSILAVWRKA